MSLTNTIECCLYKHLIKYDIETKMLYMSSIFICQSEDHPHQIRAKERERDIYIYIYIYINISIQS